MSGSHRRDRAIAPLLVLLTLLAVLLGAVPAGAAGPPGRWRLGRRRGAGRPHLVDLTVQSPALGRTAKVRLLTPSGWEQRRGDRWPVFYLLHGCCDTYDSWTRETDVEELRRLRKVLVVMPEAGPFGWYSDWWNHGAGGPPAWETFHLRELRRLLERDYGPAIAGWSPGCRWAGSGRSPRRPQSRHVPGRGQLQRRRPPAPRRVPEGIWRGWWSSARTRSPSGATRSPSAASGRRTTPTTWPGGCGTRPCSCRSVTAPPGPRPTRRRRRARGGAEPPEPSGGRPHGAGRGAAADRLLRAGDPHLALLGAGVPTARCPCSCAPCANEDRTTLVVQNRGAADGPRVGRGVVFGGTGEPLADGGLGRRHPGRPGHRLPRRVPQGGRLLRGVVVDPAAAGRLPGRPGRGHGGQRGRLRVAVAGGPARAAVRAGFVVRQTSFAISNAVPAGGRSGSGCSTACSTPTGSGRARPPARSPS